MVRDLEQEFPSSGLLPIFVNKITLGKMHTCQLFSKIFAILQFRYSNEVLFSMLIRLFMKKLTWQGTDSNITWYMEFKLFYISQKYVATNTQTDPKSVMAITSEPATVNSVPQKLLYDLPTPLLIKSLQWDGQGRQTLEKIEQVIGIINMCAIK